MESEIYLGARLFPKIFAKDIKYEVAAAIIVNQLHIEINVQQKSLKRRKENQNAETPAINTRIHPQG